MQVEKNEKMSTTISNEIIVLINIVAGFLFVLQIFLIGLFFLQMFFFSIIVSSPGQHEYLSQSNIFSQVLCFFNVIYTINKIFFRDLQCVLTMYIQ